MAEDAKIFEDNDISSNSLLINESDVVSPVMTRANSHCLKLNIEDAPLEYILEYLSNLLNVDVRTLTILEVMDKLSKLWDKL